MHALIASKKKARASSRRCSCLAIFVGTCKESFSAPALVSLILEPSQRIRDDPLLHCHRRRRNRRRFDLAFARATGATTECATTAAAAAATAACAATAAASRLRAAAGATPPRLHASARLSAAASAGLRAGALLCGPASSVLCD